jgi:hypothetical protein
VRAPIGQVAGGTRYHCQVCAASGAIVEVLTASDVLPPISDPSNACTRR